MWSIPLFLVALTSLSNPISAEPATSPPHYPSPWGSGAGEWADAYTKARAFVKQLTLLEKVNLTTGVGCVNDIFYGASRMLMVWIVGRVSAAWGRMELFLD